MLQVINYLKFLIKSTNQHGVHSPFVYNYVTKCLYSKARLSKSKTRNVLLKSISFFHQKDFSILMNEDLQKIMPLNLPFSFIEKAPFNFVYFEKPDCTKILNTIQNEKINSSGMIMVNSIYRNVENQHDWKKIVESPCITVSIDLFHCGILFIRKEQVKEHFIIRI